MLSQVIARLVAETLLHEVVELYKDQDHKHASAAELALCPRAPEIPSRMARQLSCMGLEDLRHVHRDTDRAVIRAVGAIAAADVSLRFGWSVVACSSSLGSCTCFT
jgi:hypothetical protein